MKKLLLPVILFITISNGIAQEIDSTKFFIDLIESTLSYDSGMIELESGNATLNVPEGFKFLDRSQSIYVLTDLWGNPADSSVIGMLVPVDKKVLETDAWVFTISFDEMGYVEDDDANDIDYDELLKEQQNEIAEINPERVRLGYQPIELVGWASAPFYDQNKKILHWAKELKFGEDSLNTLNYNLRILGRKGIFMLNAIATMSEYKDVDKNIDKVVASVEFKEGHRYADFIPDVDNVAAWTVGGLVAGKVLGKVGFFALILKFWKFIAIGVAGFAGAMWRRVKGRKKETEESKENLPSEEQQK